MEASKLLKDLVDCSVIEERFLDASYYTWLRAKQCLQFLNEEKYFIVNLFLLKFNLYNIYFSDNTEMVTTLKEYHTLHRLSNIYYAYSTIHNYLREPFTSNPPLTLFNTSRFVANSIEGVIPPTGVSMLYPFKIIKLNDFHIFKCFS